MKEHKFYWHIEHLLFSLLDATGSNEGTRSMTKHVAAEAEELEMEKYVISWRASSNGRTRSKQLQVGMNPNEEACR